MTAPHLSAEELDALPCTYLGPTWTGLDGEPSTTGPWKLPEKTLGWQIVRWCTEFLLDLDDDSKPWKFTLEQLRFILWWYAVDERGRFVYRAGVLQRLKGWGKDPLGAVLCLIEFVGPSQFAGWDRNGQPIGRAHRRSWVQVAAVSIEQTVNTMSLMPSLMSQKLMEFYGIKPGSELIRAHRGRCRLESVTSNYRALEGKRSTFVLLNETHHWVVGNGGPKMYEVINGNLVKMACRYLAITNAYLPGEDSVAERMREAYERIAEGRAVDVGFLYDSIEAHSKTPLTEEALAVVLPKIRGDAFWLDLEAIMAAIQDTTISAARSRRMWLNQIIADQDALVTPDLLRTIERPDATLVPGDEIVLGFDGARVDDSTALVAIRVKDHVSFLIGLWERPKVWDEKVRGRWEVPVDEVDSEVSRAFRLYKVKAFFADVHLWESYIATWTEKYGQRLTIKATQNQPIGWDMRQSLQILTRAHERFLSSIKEQKVLYDGNRDLRRHALNARARENDYGVYFGKESQDSTKKIDAYAAWLLAHEALSRFMTNPRPEKKRTGVAHFL
jgi:hypothetical protein